MQAVPQRVRSLADMRLATTTKRSCLCVLSAFITLWWFAVAVYSVLHWEPRAVVYAVIVIGVSALGFWAAWTRRRGFLLIVHSSQLNIIGMGNLGSPIRALYVGQYIVGVAIVVVLSAVGLVILTISGALTLSLDRDFLVAFIINIALMLLESFSVVLAYSLFNSLGAEGSVEVVGSPSDPSHQEFSFSDKSNAVEMEERSTPQGASASPMIYHPASYTAQPSVAPIVVPIHGYGQGFPGQHQPYGYPQQGTQAPSLVQQSYPTMHPPDDTLAYGIVETQPIYENDIIGDSAV